ncbi:MAG: ammonium transporter [Roseobacter sp.]
MSVAADTEKFALQSNLDHVWTMTAAGLVFMMQAGFLLLEAGHVRSKNSVNVAQKNLMDFVLSTLAFGSVGFALMFGASQGGWVGFDSSALFFGATEDWSMTFFVFQLVFCGTAATIVSGAVAERMSMVGYVSCTLILATLIYPLVGHWAWGGLLNGDENPFLAAMGFMDFAGSTVVHSTGAWVALAAIIVIGPRLGKFDDDGRPRVLHGHSPVLSTLGCVILWVGWIGFNGGSTTAGTSDFAQIVMNTMIAGAAGGFAQMIAGRLASGYSRPEFSINGSLGGLVGITAGCDAVTAQAALVIGLTAGLVAWGFALALEHWAKLDDPLGAVSVHGAAGAWGTILTGLFAKEEYLLADSRMEQVAVQATGVAVTFVWAFGVAFVLLKVIAAVVPANPDGTRRLRVSEEDERIGLNVSEHNAPMGTGILQEKMALVANNPEIELQALEVDYGDEAYETTVLFNRILENMQSKRDEEQARVKADLEMRESLETQIGDVISACTRGDFTQRLDVAGMDGFLRDLSSNVNQLCAATSESLAAVSVTLAAVAQGDLTQRVEGEYEGLLGDIQTSSNQTLDQLSKAMKDVQDAVFSASQGDFSRRVDLSDKAGFIRNLCEGVNNICSTSQHGLQDLADVLNQLASGDLTAEMKDNYSGQFRVIRDAVTATKNGISDIVNELTEVADEVAETARNTAQTSESLRRQSESQATMVEHSMNTLTAIDEMAKGTTTKSNTANEKCQEALKQAEAGQSVVAETASQMQVITEAAKHIAETVEQIDSIASQTNLLSLNASVEAARAGSSNSGFKVVAAEVRSLAQHAADAVLQIRARTDEVCTSVERGGELVQSAKVSLDDIVSSVSGGTALVDDVAISGDLQAERVSEASYSITKINAETKASLELVESTHSAAERLARNASDTRKILARFKTATSCRKAA